MREFPAGPTPTVVAAPTSSGIAAPFGAATVCADFFDCVGNTASDGGSGFVQSDGVPTGWVLERFQGPTHFVDGGEVPEVQVPYAEGSCSQGKWGALASMINYASPAPIGSDANDESSFMEDDANIYWLGTSSPPNPAACIPYEGLGLGVVVGVVIDFAVPPPRSRHSFVQDIALRQQVIYGGYDFNSPLFPDSHIGLKDTWVMSSYSWNPDGQGRHSSPGLKYKTGRLIPVLAVPLRLSRSC